MFTRTAGPKDVDANCQKFRYRKLLECDAIDVRGQARKILVIWEIRALELNDIEEGAHSISFHSKNYEDNSI